MSPLLIIFGTFALFITALMSPGPDFIAVVRSAMTHGARAGLLTALGVSTGLGIFATLSMTGLAILLEQYQWLAISIRLIGGAYLIYLGMQFLRSQPQPMDRLDTRPADDKNPFIFGLLVTLTNPKSIIVFSSLFATIITPGSPHWMLPTIVALVFAVSVLWFGTVSIFMSSTPVVRRVQGVKHWIERIAGACFIALGGKLILDLRKAA